MKKKLAWILYKLTLLLQKDWVFYFPTNPGVLMKKGICIRCRKTFRNMPMAISLYWKGKSGCMCPNCYAVYIFSRKPHATTKKK